MTTMKAENEGSVQCGTHTHTHNNWQGLQRFLPGAKQIISLPYFCLRILVRKRHRVSPLKAWG